MANRSDFPIQYVGTSHPYSTAASERVFQAEYLLTRAPNGTNDHQNNFQFGSGIVIRLGQ
jgi:hypothetical protein